MKYDKFYFVLIFIAFSLTCKASEPKQGRNFAKQSSWTLSEYSGKRSEKATRRTLLSKGFAWLSGSPADNEILSIGKSSQFFGFVALRYESGRAAKRGNIGRAFYQIASPEQRALILQAVYDKTDAVEGWWQTRSEVLDQLETYLHTGSKLNAEEMESLGRRFGWLNAKSALFEAEAIAALERKLSPYQWDSLKAIRKSPDLANQFASNEKRISGLSNLSEIEVARYEDLFAKAFSWLTGSIQHRQVIPLGQPAQFFGFVAIRHKSGHGASRGKIAKKFSKVLDKQQLSIIDKAAKRLQPWVTEYISTRNKLLIEMENLRAGENSFDAAKFKQLAEALGVLEIKCALIEAQAYQEIKSTMTEKQTQSMMEIRADYILDQKQVVKLSLEQRGEKLMTLCTGCHRRESHFAPNISGIFGQKIANQDYLYSNAMKTYANNKGLWSEDNIDDFLQAPHIAVPGTKMDFKGLANESDRQAVIQYLKTH